MTTSKGLPVFVDTLGWADPVLKNTPDHERMTAYQNQLFASQRPIVTTNYIITELVALLTIRAHQMSRPNLVSYVNDILAIPWLQVVHIDAATHAEAWAMLEQYTDKEWSLVDAASFVVMRRMGISEAFTSDHHFAQAGLTRAPQMP